MARYKQVHNYDGKAYDEKTGEAVFYVSSEVDGAYYLTDGAGYSRLFHGFMSLLRFLERNSLIVEWF